jgi:hypothetical protein
VSSNDLPTIRNGADVILRNMLAKVGITGVYGVALFLLIGVIIGYFVNKGKFKGLSVSGSYLLLIIIESVIWSILLSVVMDKGQLLLSKESSGILLQQIVLSIGSGLFEEFLFRVVLVSGIALIIGIFFRKYWTKMTIAIVIGASIFSYFHFVGEFANEISINLFLLRILAGIILGYIYVLRGFSIVAYTHSFYNLFVFTQIHSII